MIKWFQQKGHALYLILFGITFLACSFGYVANIVKLINVINDPITGFFVLRCVGIFVFPLGIIAGYF